MRAVLCKHGFHRISANPWGTGTFSPLSLKSDYAQVTESSRVRRALVLGVSFARWLQLFVEATEESFFVFVLWEAPAKIIDNLRFPKQLRTRSGPEKTHEENHGERSEYLETTRARMRLAP